MEYTTRIIKINGCTLIINRPILSEAEQRKDEQKIRDALKCYRKDEK